MPENVENRNGPQRHDKRLVPVGLRALNMRPFSVARTGQDTDCFRLLAPPRLEIIDPREITYAPFHSYWISLREIVNGSPVLVDILKDIKIHLFLNSTKMSLQEIIAIGN